MAIDFDKFVSWAENRFNGDVVVTDTEVKINSIFAEDFKHHLWCNPTGGKNERDHGVYHCWKTDKKGTLISLVMQVDQCTYDDALTTLDTGDVSLAELERKMEKFFDTAPSAVLEKLEQVKTNGIQLPENTHLITELDEDNYYRMTAEMHLTSRKMPLEGFYVCADSSRENPYRGRLIIPYYDRKGTLFYFNARYLGESKDIPKYMGPPKEIGIGKGDVVYMPHWPEAGSKIHIAEGEFDAKALELSGFNGAGCGGKNLSESQLDYLRGYYPVLCLDNDKAGKYALSAIGAFMTSQGFPQFSYVRPPTKFKDWNEMYVQSGPKIVKAYITINEKVFDKFTADSMKIGLS